MSFCMCRLMLILVVQVDCRTGSSLADLLEEGISGLLSRYTPLLVGTQALRRALTTRLKLPGLDAVGVVVIMMLLGSKDSDVVLHCSHNCICVLH